MVSYLSTLLCFYSVIIMLGMFCHQAQAEGIYQQPEVLEISLRKNFTAHNCHPSIVLHTIVVMRIAGTWRGGRIPHYISTITSESWRVQNLILSTTIVVNGQDPW